MLALGHAGSRAGGLDCRVGDLGVTLGGDFLLCNENRITNRAVLSLSLAGFRAGGRNCFVNDFSVAVGRDFLLCNENLIADRAMLAFGLAGFRAGRLDCFVNDLGVAVGFALRDLTNRAGFRSCAGSILPLVTVGRDRLRLGRITDAAGEGLHAGVSAGCSGGDSAVIPGVTASPAGLEGQVGKGEKLWSVPLSIFKLVWVPYRFTHRSGDQPAIEKLSLRGSKAAARQRVGCVGASVWNLHRVHRPRAAICVKGDGQLFKLVEYRHEINVLMRIEAPAVDSFRLIIGSPAIQELIGVVIILQHYGFLVFLKPHIVICVFFTGIVTFL